MSDEPGIVKTTLCGLKSPLGWLAEKLVGSASICWCCSFWRGVMWGMIFSAATLYIIYGG